MIFVILGIIAGISTYVLALTLYFTLNKDEPVSYHHSNTQAGWLFLITYIYLYTIVEWWKNRIRSKIYIHVYEEIRERVEFRGLPQSGQKKGHCNIINYTSESLCRTIILNFDLDSFNPRLLRWTVRVWQQFDVACFSLLTTLLWL